MPGTTLPEPSMPNRHTRTERPFATETHHTMNYWKALFVCFYGCPNLPFKKQDFSCSGGPKWDPPVTFELKVREQNQLGFWNISIRPTSGASFIEIGRPTFSTSGTRSQTMTVKVAQNSFQHIPRLRFWCVIITTVYKLMLQSWYQNTAQPLVNALVLFLWHNRLL